jgi:hypothetical protein
LKGATLFKTGSVEIMGRSNDEFERGHVKFTLSEQQILYARFYIKYVSDGIMMYGSGMRKPKHMKWHK